MSIVVTTKNEESRIKQCLTSIIAQSYPNIEICVVDNFSSDLTKKIVQSLGIAIYCHGPERSAQRNFGLLQKSKGKYGMYVDADMILSQDLVGKCVETIERQEDSVSGIYIPEIILGNSLFNRVRRFERGFYNGTVIDAVRFFTMESFRDVGGFDEQLFNIGSGEDWDLDKKLRIRGPNLCIESQLGKKMIIRKRVEKENLTSAKDDCFIIHDETELKLKEYINKKKYYSIGFSGYKSKWKASNDDVKKQFGAIYRLFTVFFENGKWRILCKKPHYYVIICIIKIYIALRIFSFKIGKG